MHEFFFEKDYPEPQALKIIYKLLGDEKQSIEALKENYLKTSQKSRSKKTDASPNSSPNSLKEELFEKSLEKLRIHEGVILDLEGNASRGKATWEKTYLQQREHKKKQVTQMTEFTQSLTCRMLSLVNYFGDQNDSGTPCGNCDICVPLAKESLVSARKLTRPEQKIVSQIISILSHDGDRAAGRVFQELSDTHSSLSRQQGEKLFRILAVAKWIQISHETFEKDGRTIPYRLLSLTRAGKNVTSKDFESLKIVDSILPSKLKKSKTSRLRRQRQHS